MARPNLSAVVASLVPKSVECLRDYSWSKFFQDLVAGITVGLVALPLAMAFAISSGVLPQAGIYCAIVAGFLISAFGGSRTQIGGPTGAFVVVVAGIVEKHGIDGLFMTTMIAGVFLMILGVTGLGTAVKFIPRPVVIGFTNGIAVLIASTQIKDFFGLNIAHVPGEFIGRMDTIFNNFSSIDAQSTGLAMMMLALIILFTTFVKRVPGAIVAMLLGTLLVWILKIPVDTIETRFGGIPSGAPAIHIPNFRAELILPLMSSIITVTMLGAIESLLSAVVSDRMSGDKHNPNMELFAQGIANIVSPLFGGLPATGAIARTATNVRSGARTPMAGMIHAVVLLIILLVGAEYAKLIPLCVLSAILFVVAYNMGEWREIPEIIRLGRAPTAVWLITFMLTVFADLTVAVEAGMILACLLFVGRITATTRVERITPEDIESADEHSLQTNELPEGVAIYRIHGPFMFGSTDKLDVIERDLEDLPKVVMLRLRDMNAMDTTGIKAIEHIGAVLKRSNRYLLICGLRGQPLELFERAHLGKILGEENVLPSLRAGIQRASALLASEVRPISSNVD
ncbi:MAG: SulP family inorganic anion transporter [Fimbriimonadaceae bacterium]